MTFAPAQIRAYPFAVIRKRYRRRDAILYALGVGYGLDADQRQLPFVYEQGDLAAPTLPVVLGAPGAWWRDPRLGIAADRVVHGEQDLELLQPPAPEGDVVASTRVTGLVDKGLGRGALLYTERTVCDAATDAPIAIARSTAFLRGNGGFTGSDEPRPQPAPTPNRPHDLEVDLPTTAQAALIYRLSGDCNPLHADPEVARSAGFPGAILHGLATYAVAGHAILRGLCDYEPTRIRRLFGRLSAPVLPGDTIRTEIWHTADGARFRCVVPGRDGTVLTHGLAVLR